MEPASSGEAYPLLNPDLGWPGYNPSGDRVITSRNAGLLACGAPALIVNDADFARLLKIVRSTPPAVGLTTSTSCDQAKAMRSRQDFRNRPRAGILARQALGFVTVLALTLATFFGGQRYLFCRPMNRIVTETDCPCVRASKKSPSAPAIGVVNDCFELRVIQRLVSFTIGSDFAVPPAALTSRLPAFNILSPRADSVAHRADQPIRAGPFSPTAIRAQLMVFLT